ncbi:hypothetical protein NADE_003241 [Nannochloris sp. 'desiccata']|nr:hypothetical protein NADE_003241 [Chlorella desiccata (nom. nud.)]
MMQRVVCQPDSTLTDLGAKIIVGGKIKAQFKVHRSHASLINNLPRKVLASPTLQRGCLQRCSAAPQTFSVSDLPPETAAAWQEVATRLENLGLTPPQTEKCMIKAFGWDSQGYWRHEKEKEIPQVDQIDDVLNFLITISIATEEEQAELIAKFPELIGLKVELMEANVAKLQKAFFLKASALTGMIKRKPRALGVIVDCEGSCEGMCTRCFAHF